MNTQPTQTELAAALRQTVDRAQVLLQALDNGLPAGATDDHATLRGRLSAMESRLETMEDDRRELTERLVEVEQQTGRVMNLYVATYELHASLDPVQVQETISEIALNLLGAEHYVLILRKGGSDECEVVMAEGVGDDSLFAGGTYSGGDPVVDGALESGALVVGRRDGSEAIAVVPLRIEGATIGALVLLKLLDHKNGIEEHDRELLDLLAAHAATALVASRVYAKTDRKLRTLEGLMDLMKNS